MMRCWRVLLIGIVVVMGLGLPAPAPVAAAPVTLTLTSGPGGTVAADPPGPVYETGAIVTLTATPAAGNLFTSWFLDGTPAGWATPRKLVMDADHAVDAAFAPATAFTDFPANAGEAAAIRQISARGVILGYTPAGCAAKGLAAPCFGPADIVLRGEIAVMIVRAMGWEGDTPADEMPFVDVGGMDPEIQRALAILAARGVMQGYGNRLAGPTDPVLRIQIISLIARALVEAGLWTAATTDDPTLYPNIPASSPHRLDLVTFVRNAGPIPDRPQNQAWDDWLSPAPRAWTAQLLWQALDATFTSGPFNPSPTNSPPVATADSFGILQDTPLVVPAPGVLGNDSDPNGDPLTAVLATGPANGTLALSADGSFTYTPAAGFAGPDSFTYQARDPSGATSPAATVTITVSANDPAPTVTTTTPANGATGVAGGATLTLTFSEAVDVAGNWFQVACATGDPRTPVNTAVTGGPTTWTLDPNTDFAAGEICTVTVFASQVTDQDTNDPFDAMLANYVFAFTIDAAPTVTATTPANGASNVANNTDITVTFSEPVAVTGTWFDIACTVSGAHTAAVSGGPTIWTLNPDTDFDPGDGCTVTIVAAQVTDTDAADPPDAMATNYVFSFGADVPPTVVSTTPTNGATTVATDTTIVITFSEPVMVTGNWFTIVCATSGTRNVADTAVTTTDQTTFTINPNVDFAATGEACTVTIENTLVVDQDTDDPPDQMAAPYVFTFTIDAAPTVTSTTPANGATAVPTGATVTINFSEEVAATATAFTLACTLGGPVTFTASASPASSYTLTPDAPLPAGTTCTVTVVAAQVTDTDSGDPPDTLGADYPFSFDTIVDAAPAVTTTTPANTDTNVATGTNLTVNFSEAVNATTASFTIECPLSTGARTFALSASPAASFTLNPDVPLPAGTTCTVTVIAAQVTDLDTDEPPDQMAADHVVTFATIVDLAPSVTATTPVNNASAAPDTDITITFSEPVNVTGTWFTISCATSGAHTAVVTGGPTTFTINPDVDFTPGELCTVTIVAVQVADQDTDEPPDTMVADHIFNFTADAAPTVTGTTPLDGATGVANNTSPTVTFSEPVTVSGNWFTIVCGTSGTRNVADTVVTTADQTTFTINPNTDFAASGESCTVTIESTLVADQDGAPDNLAADYPFAFTTDAAPTVSSTTPLNGATGVASNTTIAITFSEPVNAAPGAFALSCPIGFPVAFTPSASPATSYTLIPTVPLPANTICTVTVVAAQITDVDTDDPPDNLATDFVFAFVTDAAPTVTSTTPLNGATGVASNIDIAVTFSEPVTATTSSFTISCATSGAHTVAVTGGPTTYTVNPDTDFTPGELCTVTVLAAQVADQDANDPPDTLAANHVFAFTIDTAPSVTTTTPANGATGVAPTATITVNFSESVTATTNSFTIECPATTGARLFAVSGSGTASVILTPDDDLPAGTVCTVTVLAAQISDADSGDPPDNMLANHVFSFSLPPVAENDAYNATIIGNVGVNTDTSTDFSILTNDIGSNLTINAPAATAQGGTLVVATNGTFTYTPAAGFEGADSFTYTVSNTAGTSAPATVTITTVSGVIWFVDANAGTNGDGRIGTPFSSLPNFVAGTADEADDVIFLYESATAYAGPLTLLAGQRLIGQDAGSSLATLAGLTAPADTVPLPLMNTGAPATTITGTGLTLGDTNQLHGFTLNATGAAITGTSFGTLTVSTLTVSATGGAALALTTGTVNGTFTSVSASGASTHGVSLTTVGGTFSAGGGSIAAGTTAAFAVSGGAVAITWSGGITQANNAPLLNVTGGHTGTLTFQTGTLSATNGTGLQFDNADGTYNFNGTTTLNGGDAGIDIQNGSGGAFAFGGTTITNPTGVALNVDGSTTAVTGAIAIAGAISKTSNGRLIDFNNYDTATANISGSLTCNTSCDGIEVTNNGTGSGTVNFSNATKTLNTGADTAVNLNNNTGATINFTGGGLAITTTSGNGFNATGGGTVTVQGTGNTIASTGGIALNVTSTTIGSSGLTFQSIAANGGSSGIVLSNTGSTAGLTVNGTGTTDASGGIIQSTTGNGIQLTTTVFVTLKNMVVGDSTAVPSQAADATNNIAGDGIDMNNANDVVLDNVKIARTGGHGIDGTGVTNLTISNSEILNAGDGNEENGLSFDDFAGGNENNLEGTVQITNTVIDAFAEDGINVENFAGTMTMTVTGSTIGRNANLLCSGGRCGENGILVRADGTSVIHLTVSGSTFPNVDGNGVFFVSEGTAATVSTFRFSNSTITNATAIGIVIFGGSGDHTSTIESKLDFVLGDPSANNTSITGNNATAISIQPNGKSTVRGIVQRVTVNGSTIGRGIEVLNDDVATGVIALNNNIVSNTAFNGIFANNGDSGQLSIHIRDNNVSAPLDATPPSGLAVHGIEVNPLAEAATTCLDIAGNTSAGNAASSGAGYRTRQRGPAIFQLERFTGNGTVAGDVVTFLQAQNTSGTGSATVDSSYTGVADGFCADPPVLSVSGQQAPASVQANGSGDGMPGWHALAVLPYDPAPVRRFWWRHKEDSLA